MLAFVRNDLSWFVFEYGKDYVGGRSWQNGRLDVSKGCMTACSRLEACCGHTRRAMMKYVNSRRYMHG